MFNLNQAREDSNLVRALMWLGKDENDQNIFRWTTAVLMSDVDQFGQYQVMQLSSGRFGTTNKLKNITKEQMIKTFAKILSKGE